MRTSTRSAAHEPTIRPPAVAGRFYPADPDTLRRAIGALTTRARRPLASDIVGLVAPHAGYLFSGQIAADALSALPVTRPDVLVILCPNHTGAPVHRFALSPGTAFRTPLGLVPIDQDVTQSLLGLRIGAVADAAPHREEHAIEVLLPFVQTLAPQATLVAIVVGTREPSALADLGAALAGLLTTRRGLLVASSDLSHYPPAGEASTVDRRTLDLIARCDADTLLARERDVARAGAWSLATTACGIGPIVAVMHAARRLGAEHATLVSYANSGDSAAGETQRVVGYGAVWFHRDAAVTAASDGPGTGDSASTPEKSPDTPLSPDERLALLQLARETISQYLDSETVPLPREAPASLHARYQGAFVTLRIHGELRGCIGHIVPDAPLPPLVARMAFAAAFRDTRFPELTREELDAVDVEISVLTPPVEVTAPEEIVVGRDGVVLHARGRSAVFLPQVAPARGWTRDQMLDALCAKAGLPGGCWREGASLSVFQAECFGEGNLEG